MSYFVTGVFDKALQKRFEVRREVTDLPSEFRGNLGSSELHSERNETIPSKTKVRLLLYHFSKEAKSRASQ